MTSHGAVPAVGAAGTVRALTKSGRLPSMQVAEEPHTDAFKRLEAFRTKIQQTHQERLAKYRADMEHLAQDLEALVAKNAPSVLASPLPDSDPHGAQTYLSWFLAVEDQRQGDAGLLLSQLVVDLQEIGFWTEPDIAPFVESECAVLNQIVLDNKKSYAELVRDVVQEKLEERRQAMEEEKAAAVRRRREEYEMALNSFFLPPLEGSFRRTSSELKSELDAYTELWIVEVRLLLNAFEPFVLSASPVTGSLFNERTSATAQELCVDFEWEGPQTGHVFDEKKVEEKCKIVQLRTESINRKADEVVQAVIAENEAYVSACGDKRRSLVAQYPDFPDMDSALPSVQIDYTTHEVPSFAELVSKVSAETGELIQLFSAVSIPVMSAVSAYATARKEQLSQWQKNVSEWRASGNASVDGFSLAPMALSAADAARPTLPPPFAFISSSLQSFFERVSTEYIETQKTAFAEEVAARERVAEVRALELARTQRSEQERQNIILARERRDKEREAKKLLEEQKVIEEVRKTVMNLIQEYGVMGQAAPGTRSASEVFSLQKKLAKVKERILATCDQKLPSEKERFVAELTPVEQKIDALIAERVKFFEKVAKSESVKKAKESALRLLIADSLKSHTALQAMLDAEFTTIEQVAQCVKLLYRRGIELGALREAYNPTESGVASLESRAPKDFDVAPLMEHIKEYIPVYTKQVQFTEFAVLRFPRVFFDIVRKEVMERLQNDDRKLTSVFDQSWRASVETRGRHLHQLSPTLSNPALAETLNTLLKAEDSRKDSIETKIKEYQSGSLAALRGYLDRCAKDVCGRYKALVQLLDACVYGSDLKEPPSVSAATHQHKNFRELLMPRAAVKIPDRRNPKVTLTVQLASTGAAAPLVKEDLSCNDTNAHIEAQRTAQQTIDVVRAAVEARCAEIESRCQGCLKEEQQFRQGWERTLKQIKL